MTENMQEDPCWSRQKKQSLALLLISSFLAASALYLFFWDFEFFLAPAVPVNLGDASDGQLSSLRDNTYISVAGLADPRSMFAEIHGKSYKYFIILGTPILVEQETKKTRPTGELQAFKYKGQGRLRKLSHFLRYDMMLTHFKNKLGIDLKEQGYILHEGVTPSSVIYRVGILIVSLFFLIYTIVKGVFLLVKARSHAKVTRSTQG